MGLVLGRQENEWIKVDGPCRFCIVKTGKRSQVLIEAEKSVRIVREELDDPNHSNRSIGNDSNAGQGSGAADRRRNRSAG